MYVRAASQTFNSSSVRKEIPRTVGTDFSQDLSPYRLLVQYLIEIPKALSVILRTKSNGQTLSSHFALFL